jgi:hypothetical protein
MRAETAPTKEEDPMLRSISLMLAVAAVALTAASAASARPASPDHASSWVWTPNKAAQYLLDNIVAGASQEDLTDATCTGVGRRYRGGMYRGFRCVATDDLNRDFLLSVRPVGPARAAVVQLDCDDSSSDYYCD